jgi:hypothetical protein
VVGDLLRFPQAGFSPATAPFRLKPAADLRVRTGKDLEVSKRDRRRKQEAFYVKEKDGHIGMWEGRGRERGSEGGARDSESEERSERG